MTSRILVIDDNQELLPLLRMILEDERYQVSVLNEGQDAVERVVENPPDLIILDLRLEPGVSGIDVLQGLRSRVGAADIPVVVYSAAVIEVETVSRIIRENPAHYKNVTVLPKPFELEQLLRHIKQVLGAAERT